MLCFNKTLEIVMYSRLEMQLSGPGTSKHTFADIGLETKYVPSNQFVTIYTVYTANIAGCVKGWKFAIERRAQ